MPTVQAYGGRKVVTAGIPGVRKTAAETDLSTGVGLDEARAAKFGQVAKLGQIGGQVAGQTASVVQDMHAEAQKQADEVAALSYSNALSDFANKALYDPDTGALNQKGANAQGLPEKISADFEAFTGELDAKLNDRQRAAFGRMKSSAWQNLTGTVYRHVSQEQQAIAAGELQAFVGNKHNEAVQNATDPRRVGIALADGKEAIEKNGGRLGLGPEQVKAETDKFTSGALTGVIESLLANDQTKSAQVYFDHAKEQSLISGDAATRIEKALSVGKLRGEAQKQSDAILAAGGTLTEQRDKARTIDDPELRDEVQQRLEHEAAVTERATREQEQATLRSVYDTVDKTHNVTSIPPAVWAQLDGGTRSSIRSYAEHLVKGVPIETDLPTYYALLQKAGDDPTTFATDNLLKYRAKLDDTEFKQLAGLQLSIKSGDRKKVDAELDGVRTNDAIIKDTLWAYTKTEEKDYTAAQRDARATLMRQLELQVAAEQQRTGKKASNADVQSMLDHILTTTTKTPGSWWDRFKGTTPTKRLLDLQIGDVPADQRAAIEQALKATGRAVNDQTILERYIFRKTAEGQ